MESVPLASTQAQHLDNQHPAGISGAQKDFSLRYKDALASFVFFFPLPGGLGGVSSRMRQHPYVFSPAVEGFPHSKNETASLHSQRQRKGFRGGWGVLSPNVISEATQQVFQPLRGDEVPKAISAF